MSSEQERESAAQGGKVSPLASAPSPEPSTLEPLVKEARALALRALVLLAVGLGGGFLFNSLRPDGVSPQHFEPPVACSAEEGPTLKTPLVLAPERAAPLCGNPGALVIDTRSETAFAEGHIPEAVHLPCTAPRSAAERALELVGNRSTVIVYGESTSDALPVAAGLQARAGHAPLTAVVIEGGFAAWRDAKQACASGPCEECNGEVSRAPLR